MSELIRIEGLQDIQRSLRELDRTLDRRLREELVEVAQPVRADAERLAVRDISGLAREGRALGAAPEWSEMRVGVTARLVYVVPKKHGLKRGDRKRPGFGATLLHEAMEPALHANRSRLLPKVEHMLDSVIHDAGL